MIYHGVVFYINVGVLVDASLHYALYVIHRVIKIIDVYTVKPR